MACHGALQIIPRILKIEVFKHVDAKPNDLYTHNQEDIEELPTFAAAVYLQANVDYSRELSSLTKLTALMHWY